MRYILILVVVVLSGGSVVHCADVPELEEWFRITGDGQGPIGRIFSYLPDFEPSRGGTNATVVPVHSLVPTWYNRYWGDTVNQFSWSIFSGRSIRKADLNNDGADEYITRNGLVHAGIEQGKPPEADFIKYNNYISSVTPLDFHDINNDGYVDAIANTGYFSKPWLMTVLWGGSELNNLQTQVVYRRQYEQSKTTETLVGILPQKTNGKVRLITRSFEEVGFQQASWVSYVLRELRAIAEADSIRLELVTLDSISDAGLRPAESYDLFTAVLHQSRQDEPVFFLTPVYGRNAIEVYNVSTGFFTKVQEFSTGEVLRFPSFSVKSINGDDYDEWRTATTITGKGTEYVFYAGTRGNEIDTIPFAKITFTCPLGEGLSSYGIGDVTGDGIGDFGLAINNDMGCFVIYKGIARRTVGVAEAVAGIREVRDFEMLQNYPNPVGETRSTVVPVQLARSSHYTLELFSLQGQRIAELFSGNIPAGEQQIAVDISAYELAAGMYVLRLSDGHLKRERGILLQ